MNINDFLKIKTNYVGIAIRVILSIGVMLLLFLIEIFGFWGWYGEGATASRIIERWYVNLILTYLPVVLVIGFLTCRTVVNYNKQEYAKSKANLITLLILVLLFFIRNYFYPIGV